MSQIERHGSRIYASDVEPDQQKFLIDRLGTIIDVEDEDGNKTKAKVKSVRYDKAIFEVVEP